MSLVEVDEEFQYSAGSSADADDDNDTEVATIKPTSPEFEYPGLDTDQELDDAVTLGSSSRGPGTADYSRELDDILGDGDEEDEVRHTNGFGAHDEEDDDEGFLYHGEDNSQPPPRSYKDHLRDVLGPDAAGEDSDEPPTPSENSRFSMTIHTDEDGEGDFSYEDESRQVGYFILCFFGK
jgi:hypothetical protein